MVVLIKEEIGKTRVEVKSNYTNYIVVKIIN